MPERRRRLSPSATIGWPNSIVFLSHALPCLADGGERGAVNPNRKLQLRVAF
jgi:hypothetical protein